MISLFELARLLSRAGVDFVIVGGNYITEDLDICYSRKRVNLEKLVGVLAPLEPRPRGIDEKLPFVFEWSTLQQSTNFTFTTSLGDIDLLGEVKGIGNYDDLVPHSITVDLDGFPTKILSIPALKVEGSGCTR